MQAAKTVWNNLLRQKIYKSQLEEAGITVGEADIMQAGRLFLFHEALNQLKNLAFGFFIVREIGYYFHF